MFVVEKTTTQAYPDIISRLIESDDQPSRVGDTREEDSVIVRSNDPRDRFIMRPQINLAFALQECFAYWNGENPGHVHRYNSQMERYMTNGELNGSAYGERLRRHAGDQIKRAIKQLTETPDTRRAVMVIHQPSVEHYFGKDVACTVYLHPMIRDGKLNLSASMRSQDMLWGYPYDVQAFQWIQEVMAGILDLELGWFEHRMDSCHFYTDYEDQIVNSMDYAESIELDDCRLDRNELHQAMQLLDTGLHRARNATIPEKEIETLIYVSDYYADWLSLMAAYEFNRFHDNPTVAQQMTDYIENGGWRVWMESKMEITA